MAERPRILLVGPFPPTTGGVTTFLLNLKASPLARDFEFVPFTTSRPPKRNVTENWGYRAIFQGGIGRMLAGILVTLGHLAAFPFAIILRHVDLVQVQASDYLAFWEAALYVRMARALGRPVLLRIGGAFDLFYGSSSRRMRRWIAAVLRWPDVLIAQSDQARRYFADLGRGADVLLLPNWVDASIVAAARAGCARPLRFLFIAGTEAVRKGAPEVIDAIGRARSAGVVARFHLLAVPEVLAARIRALGFGEMVEIEGTVSHLRVLEAMRRADVFILASRGEGFPNSLIEAMGSGMAAVVTPVGAVPEIIADGGALAVPIGDAGALAQTIAKLAADPALAASLGVQARRNVAARFVAATALAPLADTYRRMTASRRT